MADRRFPFEHIERLDSPERQTRQPARPLVEIIAGYGPKTVVDIGVGTGYFAVPLAQRLPSARVIGLDIEPRMLVVLQDRAKTNGVADRIDAVQMPDRTLPLADASVDVALMANLYHELPERLPFLREVRRVVRPGGRLVMCDWDPEGTADAGPPREIRVSPSAAEVEIHSAGFDTIERPHPYRDYFVIVAR